MKTTISNKEKTAALKKEAAEKGITFKEVVKLHRKENRKEHRVKTISNEQRLVLHRKRKLAGEFAVVKKHEAAETRFERILNEKIENLNQFRKHSGKSMSDEQYESAKASLESSSKREQRLIDKRINRKQRIENQKARHTEEVMKQIKHFLESESKRKAKKEEKQSKYAGKKKKVPPRKLEPKEKVVTYPYYISINVFKDKTHKERIDLDPIGMNISQDSLHKWMNHYHRMYSDLYKDDYVGTFVYNSPTLDHCILESINSKYYNIDGYLTSRIASQRAAAAA